MGLTIFKVMKRVLLSLLAVIALAALVIFGLRAWNGHRYAEVDSADTPAYFNEPSNLSLYPTDIDGVTVTQISEGSLQGFHLVPDELTHEGVLVVHGGSEGSPDYAKATLLAQQGYEVLALLMFGGENQQPTLMKIPLEQFGEALDYIEEHAVNPTPITALGASKGAEYVLNLASRYPQIDNLVLVAPSAYTFNGLDFENYGSSWTWQGKELPYVDVMHTDFSVYVRDLLIPSLVGSPITYRETYHKAAVNDENAQDKLISLDTDAQILIIAGDADQMWDSAGMGRLIAEQRPEGTELAVYEGAGHIFGHMGDVVASGYGRLAVGGSVEANERAFVETNELLLSRLDEWHPTVSDR